MDGACQMDENAAHDPIVQVPRALGSGVFINLLFHLTPSRDSQVGLQHYWIELAAHAGDTLLALHPFSPSMLFLSDNAANRAATTDEFWTLAKRSSSLSRRPQETSIALGYVTSPTQTKNQGSPHLSVEQT